MMGNGLRNIQDPVALIQAIGSLTDEDKPDVRRQLFDLCEHPDEMVRDEALRVLAVRWKDWTGHAAARKALLVDNSAMVRGTAIYGVAATSTAESREEDIALLLDLLRDTDAEPQVRGASYDALLILHRRAQFPSKTRCFDPERDVDWKWVEEIARGPVG